MTPSVIAEAPTSRSIGRYAVLRVLGRGATSEVYEALASDGQRVALKQLLVHSDRAERAQRRFAREAAIVCSLDHSNIARLIESGTSAVGPWLAFELVRGPSLHHWITNRGPLQTRDVVALMLPVIAAVKHAHELGVVHRDLKPANVVVDDAGSEPCAKVIDFGVSKMIDTVSDLVTCEGALVGTPAYMAPEQRRDARAADARSDQYALGLIMYELATGTLPSYSTADGDGAYESPRPPSVVRPALGPELDAIALRAIAYDARDRFPDVASLGRALLSLAEGPLWARWAHQFAESDGSATLDGVEPPAQRPPATRRPIAWLSSAIVITAIATAFLHRRRETPVTASPRTAIAPVTIVQPAATSTTAPVIPSPAEVAHSVAAPVAPKPAPVPAKRVVVAPPQPSVAAVAVPSVMSAPTIEIGDNGAAIVH